MEKEYVAAVIRAKEQGASEDVIADALMKTLRAEGRLRLLPRILKELKAVQRREQRLDAVLEVATEAETNSARQSAEASGISGAQIRINPSLIRGWRARKGSMTVDASAKHALLELYQQVIT